MIEGTWKKADLEPVYQQAQRPKTCKLTVQSMFEKQVKEEKIYDWTCILKPAAIRFNLRLNNKLVYKCYCMLVVVVHLLVPLYVTLIVRPNQVDSQFIILGTEQNSYSLHLIIISQTQFVCMLCLSSFYSKNHIVGDK